jgi:hypothetical protein
MIGVHPVDAGGRTGTSGYKPSTSVGTHARNHGFETMPILNRPSQSHRRSFDPHRQNSISRIMIGMGMPRSQSNAPFPRPMVSSIRDKPHRQHCRKRRVPARQATLEAARSSEAPPRYRGKNKIGKNKQCVLNLAIGATVALLISPAAPAQPANPKGNTPAVNTSNTPPNSSAPVSGANSFIEGQAKSRIESNGYMEQMAGLAVVPQCNIPWDARASCTDPRHPLCIFLIPALAP